MNPVRLVMPRSTMGLRGAKFNWMRWHRFRLGSNAVKVINSEEAYMSTLDANIGWEVEEDYARNFECRLLQSRALRFTLKSRNGNSLKQQLSSSSSSADVTFLGDTTSFAPHRE
jgi:hypothetical protein